MLQFPWSFHEDGLLRGGKIGWVLLIFCAMATAPSSSAATTPERSSYDLSAGDAVETLRQFIDISGEQVIYLANQVSGVTTQEVRGFYRAERALEIMLADTVLFPARDEKSGAILVLRREETPLPPPAPAMRPSPPQNQIIKLSAFGVDADAYRGYVASSTLIGGKTAQKILDVPQTVNVVTRDLLDDIGLMTPSDVLNRLIPGVSSVTSEGSSAAGAYIRGFRAQNWSVDGATMRTLSSLTIFNIDTLELIKGPAAVTFGAFAAYGGYVNVLPKYARKNQQNQVWVSFGTDDFYAAMVDVGGQYGEDDRFQYRLVLGVLDAGRAGWRWDFNRSQVIAPSFAYDFSPTSRIRTRFSFTNTEVKNSTTALDVGGNVVPSFSSNGPPDPHDRFNTEAGQSMQVVWEHELNDEWSLRMNLFGARGDKTFDFNRLVGQAAAPDYLFDVSQRDYDWGNFFADLSVAYRNNEIGETGISYQAVGSLSMDHWDSNYAFFDGNLISPYNGYRLDPTNPDWSVLPGATSYRYPTRYILYNTEWLGGAVIENGLGFFDNRLLLSAALRQNYDNRSSHMIWRTPQNQNPGGTYVGEPWAENIDGKTTRRFGLVYKPTNRLSIYAGSTEAFLGVGAIFKADGSRLDPETGSNEEVGLKMDLFEALGGNVSFTGALFRINVVNKWRGDPDNPGFFVQDGEQESRGVDMQLSYAGERLSLILGYFDARGPTDQLTGERAVIVPETTWNIWGKYSMTPRLSIGGGYKSIGNTISNNRLYRTDGYGTADLFVSYQHALSEGELVYRAGVSNLTDEKAVFRMDSAAAVYREEGRRIKVTASYVW